MKLPWTDKCRDFVRLLVFLWSTFIAVAHAEVDPVTLTLASFGATGDGIRDDSVPIREAFARVPAGAILDGEGKQYRLTGSFDIRRDLTLRNAAFLQQSAPKDSEGPCSLRTLLIRGEPTRPIRIAIERVKIDRGDNPHQGCPGDAAGIWIDHVVDSRLSNVEITGNGRGAGVLLAEAGNVEIRNLWVHDMTWAPCITQGEGLPWEQIYLAWNSYQVVPMDNCMVKSLARVRIQEPLTGLLVVRSRNVRIIDPIIERLYAQFADGRRLPWQTDGIGIGSGSVDFIGRPVASDILIQRANISQVWEGIDIAGDPVVSVSIDTANIEDIHAFGVKVANGAADVRIRQARVANSGLAGFVVSGKNTQSSPYPATHQIDIQDSQSINTGSNGYWKDQATIAGFRVMRGGVSGPAGVRITRSQALDEQKIATMKFGFHSECRDAMALDDVVALGYITTLSHIESFDCALESR